MAAHTGHSTGRQEHGRITHSLHNLKTPGRQPEGNRLYESPDIWETGLAHVSGKEICWGGVGDVGGDSCCRGQTSIGSVY